MKFSSDPNFVPGLVLSERFFHSAVEPLLATHFPALPYSTARLSRGSDVMGFDTPQSRDHHWGPKTTLFLTEEDVRRYHDRIVTMLGNELPFTIDGYPTHFDRPNVDGGFLTHTDRRPIAHGVNVTTIGRFTRDYLGLAAVRERLHWFPRDVWLYRMANQWRRIDQEEPWIGRCGDVGDELGSRIVAARLIVELMRLCFLIEREYWPYFKWCGTAFSRLRCATTVTPIFHDVMNASDWKAREVMIGGAYLHVGAMHNELGVTEVVEPRLAPFFGRPYQVPHAMRFVDALMGAVESPTLRSLPPYVGSIDQFADSTDVLDDIPMAQALMSIYDVKR